jgi:hypothetical protein
MFSGNGPLTDAQLEDQLHNDAKWLQANGINTEGLSERDILNKYNEIQLKILNAKLSNTSYFEDAGKIFLMGSVSQVPDRATDSPGEGWEWRGKGPVGGKEGSWYNPSAEESLHPDLNHPDGIQPHWDYTDPSGDKWRIFLDGTIEPK